MRFNPFYIFLGLTEQEQSILDARNSSAIVQYVGKDQEVSVSFLEPESNSSNGGSNNPLTSLASLIQSNKGNSNSPMSPGAIANFLSVAAAVQQAKASGSSSLPTVPRYVSLFQCRMQNFFLLT